MKQLVGIMVLAAFLPIEISSSPAPIALGTLLVPLTLLLSGLIRSNWTFAALLILLLGVVLSTLNSLFTSSFTPLLSFFSFSAPMFGIFLGLNERKSSGEMLFAIRNTWILAVVLAGALAINLFANWFVVRTAVDAFNPIYGYYSAASAAGSIYGLKMFASFGVNSFAGILLATFFLCILSLPRIRGYRRVMLIASIFVIVIYGLMLQSRMFFVGISVFIFVFAMRAPMPFGQRLLLIIAGATLVVVPVVFDERLRFTFELLFQGGLRSTEIEILTSNRSSLLQDIPSGIDLLLGNAFGGILSLDHASNSFHFYAITALAKGGAIFTLPIMFLIIKSLQLPPSRHSRIAFEDVVINASLWSFLAQSLMWDIFAVQVYGHIGWMFVGFSLVRATRRESGASTKKAV